MSMGYALYQRWRIYSGSSAFRAGIALYDPQEHRSHAFAMAELTLEWHAFPYCSPGPCGVLAIQTRP